MTNLSVKSCIVSICHHQDGYSALMMAARDGWTEVVSLLVKAGANTDLQNKVVCSIMYEGVWWFYCVRYTSSSCVNGLVCVTNLSVKSCIVSVCHHTGWRLCTDDSCQPLE